MKNINATDLSGSKNENQDGSQTSKPVDEKVLLQAFFVNELKDVYWSEKYLGKTIPRMEFAATAPALKDIFYNQLNRTERQIHSLEKVFAIADETVQAKKCESMEGIIREVEIIISETDEGTLTRDAGLILAAQKIEHYKIATYGGLAQITRTLGEADITAILEKIVSDEKEADEILSVLAEEHINAEAMTKQSELEEAEEE